MNKYSDYFEANKKLWNQRTIVHKDSSFYNLAGFKAGENVLTPIELNELGDVKGKKMLHLQCHFGMDSLNWARLGADVTGVDLSDEAIKEAKQLNDELAMNAKFICCNVYDLKEHLDEKFDIVFTSYGTIGWLPDLDKWAGLIAHYLKPGGTFYPALDVLFQLDPFEGARDRADGLARHAFEVGDPGVFAGQDHVGKGEIGDRKADGLGTFQRVRGGRDTDIGTARHQCRDAVGERGFDDFGGDAQHGGQIVAVVDVKAHRIVVGIARPHRRKVQHHRTAQHARGDDVVQLVGLRRTCGQHRGDTGHGNIGSFHWSHSCCGAMGGIAPVVLYWILDPICNISL